MASAEDKRLGVYFVRESDLAYDEGANSTFSGNLRILLRASRISYSRALCSGVRFPPRSALNKALYLDTAFQRRWNMRLIENTFENVRGSLAEAAILDTGVSWRALFRRKISAPLRPQQGVILTAQVVVRRVCPLVIRKIALAHEIYTLIRHFVFSYGRSRFDIFKQTVREAFFSQ